MPHAPNLHPVGARASCSRSLVSVQELTIFIDSLLGFPLNYGKITIHSIGWLLGLLEEDKYGPARHNLTPSFVQIIINITWTSGIFTGSPFAIRFRPLARTPSGA